MPAGALHRFPLPFGARWLRADPAALFASLLELGFWSTLDAALAAPDPVLRPRGMSTSDTLTKHFFDRTILAEYFLGARWT